MKKTVVLLTAALCLLAAQAFAGGQSSQPPSSGGEKEVTLTMVNRVNADVKIEGNPIFQYIKEKTGFNIELEAPPINNYNDRLQIIMASGNLPDLIYFWQLGQEYYRWAEDGLLHPVEERIKNYPNIVHNVTPNLFEAERVPSKGEAYVVPRVNKINRWGMIMNKEWLAKLGSKTPETIDEFYEYGKKVALGDPDGNGQNDTYLYSPVGNVFANSGVIMDAFLPSQQFGAPDFDGIYKIREKMNGYYPYLEFMRKLYAEKILDPEYFVNKYSDDTIKLGQGRIALAAGHDSNITGGAGSTLAAGYDRFTLVPPIKAADGKSRNYVGAATWGGWALPVSSKKTEDALRFLDWGNSPEGFEILNYGIKGLTYNSLDLTARRLDQTTEQRKLWPTITSSYMTVSYAYEGKIGAISNDPVITENYNRELNNYLVKVEEIPMPPVKLPEWNAFQAENPDLITKKEELENKYVIGDIGINELRTFINNEWLPKAARYEAAYLKLMAARR